MGCGGDDDELVIGDNYLPIEVGNFWTFIPPEYPDDPATIAITGTTKLSSGKTVLVAKVTYDKEVAELGYLSRAADDLLLFHQAVRDLQGELIYRPPIKVGTTWRGDSGEAEVVAKETVNTPAGTFKDCFQVNVRSVDDRNDFYYAIWLAKHVGPVKIAQFDEDWEIERIALLDRSNAR